ncbi:hypothetical protein [Streptomyces sp. NPDC059761]|uniref:hypothetical protein n=1 Tax=Streptomyces sp. NPDC059761 TaxID=3346937 RepID=UPI003652DD3F
MTRPLLADLRGPLEVLGLFAIEYPHLSAPCVNITTIYPDRLELAFHGDVAGFEGWCEALDISPGLVHHSVQSDHRTAVRKVELDYAGICLRLISYTPIPAPGGERSRAEAAS